MFAMWTYRPAGDNRFFSIGAINNCIQKTAHHQTAYKYQSSYYKCHMTIYYLKTHFQQSAAGEEAIYKLIYWHVISPGVAKH